MNTAALRPAIVIAERELRAYFLSPSGYIILGLFLLITGGFFYAGGFADGEIASMRSVFGVGTWLLAFIAPAITMRLLSEEYRGGTYETLITSPINEKQIVLGKFAGAMGFLIILLAPTLIYVVVLEAYGRPDYGELFSGYLGMFLAGAAYLASGLLASALTNSQPVAFLVSLFFWLALGFATKSVPESWSEQSAGLVYVDPELRLNDFVIGLVDGGNIAYFLAFTVVFLIAATHTLQSRKWR